MPSYLYKVQAHMYKTIVHRCKIKKKLIMLSKLFENMKQDSLSFKTNDHQFFCYTLHKMDISQTIHICSKQQNSP